MKLFLNLGVKVFRLLYLLLDGNSEMRVARVVWVSDGAGCLAEAAPLDPVGGGEVST